MASLLRSRIFWAVLAIPLGAFLLGVTFWNFRNSDPMWAVVSFVLVYDPDMRAALATGLARLGHTILGTGIALGAIAIFGLHKWLMPLSLGFAALLCGVLLHFRSSWRTLLVTVALVIGSCLLEPAAGLHIALLRSLEVTAGSLLAIAFSLLVARLSGPPKTD